MYKIDVIIIYITSGLYPLRRMPSSGIHLVYMYGLVTVHFSYNTVYRPIFYSR